MDESKMGAPRRRQVAAFPSLETLEGRRLLAARALAMPSAKEYTSNGVTELIITGTNKADVINIADNGTDAAGNITVTYGDGSTFTSTNAIAAIMVTGKGGERPCHV